MKSPKAPEAPDPAKTAQAQAEANRKAILDSASVNQINEVGPFGSVAYSGDIGSSNRTRTTSLSPQIQKLVDTLSGYGDAGPMSTDFSGDAEKVERATYDRAMSLLNPDIERDQRRLETKLVNQGLPIGSEAYNDEMTRQSRSVNEARTRAAMDAVGAGRQEQSRMFDINSKARAQPINELASIISGIKGADPNFANPAQYQINPADVMGATQMGYQGAMNTYNQKMGQRNSMLGGLAGLGSSYILANAPIAAAACWVAEELYGKDDYRTFVIRSYVLSRMNESGVFGMFCRLYRKHGRTWARWVKSHRVLRAVAKKFFDRLFRMSVELKYG